ncbi:MAG: SPFH domain-containing protein [Candidatus Sumerlaeota bacterium]|nr:SPFH domain-containing protein [Candidatus Sumerlaeota bacterium]
MNILMYIIAITVFIVGVIFADGRGAVVAIGIVMLICDAFFLLATILVTIGFVIIQPNEAAVLLLFGKYVGTLKQEGFWWVNPFYTKKKISLRLRNLNSDKLKVNDKSGNPIEIAAVIVWKVEDTYAAFFEVDNYTAYVNIQSESAIRHLASAYHYDNWEDEHAISLRSHIDEVSVALEKELENRLIKAGVRVLEARLMHLAYAPEIAETMLRRQQATAIIAARQKIVEGAVSMVRMALEKLDTEKVVHLDEERRATMVSNLLVVLCGESHVQPVVNAGTLYT